MANHKVTWETDEYGDFNTEITCLGKAGDDCWRWDIPNCESTDLNPCWVAENAMAFGFSAEFTHTTTGAWEITFASWGWIREDGVIKFTEPLGPPVPITIPMKGIQK